MTSCTSTLWDLNPNIDCRHQACPTHYWLCTSTYIHFHCTHTCTHMYTHTQDFALSPVPRHTSTQTTQPCPHCSSGLLSRPQTTNLAHLAVQAPPVLFLVCLAPYLQLMGQSGSVMAQLCSAAIKLELERGHLCWWRVHWGNSVLDLTQ